MPPADRSPRPFSPHVLDSLAAELTHLVSGAELQEVLQQDPSFFRFVLVRQQGVSSLVVCLEPTCPGAFLEDSLPRKARRVTDPGLNALAGAELQSISSTGTGLSVRFKKADDKVSYVLYLSFETRGPLLTVFRLHPDDPARENAELIASFPNRSQSRPAPLALDLPQDRPQAQGTPPGFRVCYTAKPPGPATPVSVVASSEPCPEGTSARHHDTANQAVRDFVYHGLHRLRYETLKASLEKTLRKRLKKVKRRLQNIQNDLAEATQADQFRQFGDLLLAHATQNKRGLTQIKLPAFDGTGFVTVQLDPTKTLVENAQEYYRKARKLEGKRRVAEKRLEESIAEQKELERLLTDVAEARSVKELRALATKAGIDLAEAETSTSGARPRRSARQTRQPFLHFVSADGLEILAGRSAEDNAKLTFQVAKEHDFWFHAAGTAGSHVIVRNPRRLEKCPPRTAEQAAALAAYLSKNRNSSNVLVHFTQKRYLKKQKGGPPGAVIMKAFQSMFAKPALPTSDSQGENSGVPG